MRGPAAFTGLGTQVAARTFLMFCLCAVIPILLASVLSYRVVSSSSQEQASNRLRDTSKAYGLLVFERLRQADEMLFELSGVALKGGPGVHELRHFESSRMKIVSLVTLEGTADKSGTTSVADRLTLSLHPSASGQEVQLMIERQKDSRTVRLVGALKNEYLWNDDAIILNETQICVHLADQILHCTGQSVAGKDSLSSEWTLFLPPRYHAAPWVVKADQANAIALRTLDSLRRTTIIVTFASILIALLLSVIQIRRSHQPLTQLMQAARRLGKRRFDQRIEINSKDEYAKLGHAFNAMAGSLSRQFLLLRTLARIDRLILEEPSMVKLVKRVLPSLPRLLGTPDVGLLIESDDQVTVYLARGGLPGVQVLEVQHRSLSQLALLNGKKDFDLIAAGWPDVAAALSCQRVIGLRIDVESRLRGMLLMRSEERLFGSARRRHAQALSRRFAIAMGSEARRAALLRQAYYDPLTNLPNRQLFKDRLEQDLARARQTGTSLALIYIDLDRFKNINDSLGHSVGDQLLCEVGRRFAAQMSSTDTLARLGGDEFVVIASNHDGEPAHLLVERLQASLSEPVTTQGSQCFVRASFGLTVYPRDAEESESLLRHADTAMYRAKATGRGGLAYFEEAMNREVQHRLRVEQRLRIALRDKTLQLAYQPKVRLVDGAIHGVEALARWNDPELGWVSPAEFIAVAEECGLIEELGAWALLEACTMFAECLNAGMNLDHVSVNASMRQLREERFLNDVSDALRASGIPANALEIEVTESSLAGDPIAVAATLNRLRDLGIRVAIDDFGTGYSSMSALSVLPTDVLKIDRSFIDGCDTNSSAASVVEAIISVAHVLGKTTIAEGVETVEQLTVLRRLGCDCVQGYLFARPMSRGELPQLTQRSSAWRELLAGTDLLTLPTRRQA